MSFQVDQKSKNMKSNVSSVLFLPNLLEFFKDEFLAPIMFTCTNGKGSQFFFPSQIPQSLFENRVLIPTISVTLKTNINWQVYCSAGKKNPISAFEASVLEPHS